MPEQGKVRETSGEGSFRYRRANRSLCVEKGAKDKPNQLTAIAERPSPKARVTEVVPLRIFPG